MANPESLRPRVPGNPANPAAPKPKPFPWSKVMLLAQVAGRSGFC